MCFEKGQLTDNFRSENVKLIPKKGNCSKIKNWRPISLLNCFYKILSRVFAERLKTVIDKITAVGQKGYSSSRQCQEVLINLIDDINLCKNRNKAGALISLDIRKAFDTISHNYLLEAYKFFNFGDNIIKWLQILGTNRRACITLENGLFTKFFDLERGTAQNRRAYAFADDANIFTKLNRDTLLRVKYLLEEFGKLSGLECNVEKTTVMCVNSNVPEYMAEIGFAVVDSVTILGLEIEGDSGEFNRTFKKIHTKVRNNIATWKRFNLSLPGRVCIAKTMLYSQVNYIGCFLEIPQQYVKRISDLICDYVCGDLNIAAKRLFLPAQMCGLGLFELDSFWPHRDAPGYNAPLTWMKNGS